MHLRVVVAGAGAVAVSVFGAKVSFPVAPIEAPASVDVTVVDETCLDPDERRLLEEPAKSKAVR